MKGLCVAYIPCSKCEENKCNICELSMYRDGTLTKDKWISVDERLPELEDGRNWGNHRPKSIRVLCVCQQRSGKTFVKEGYYELFSNKPCWRIPGSIDTVTHWMPLPEPPKKGKVTAESAIKSLQEAAHELKGTSPDDSLGISLTMQS